MKNNNRNQGRNQYRDNDYRDRNYGSYGNNRGNNFNNNNDSYESRGEWRSGRDSGDYGKLRGQDYDNNQQGRGAYRSSSFENENDYREYDADYRSRVNYGNQSYRNNQPGRRSYGSSMEDQDYDYGNRGAYSSDEWNTGDSGYRRGNTGYRGYDSNNDDWNYDRNRSMGSGSWSQDYNQRNDWNDSNRSSAGSGSNQHRGKGPKGYKRSDQRIQEDINDQLSYHGDIDATDIEVKVQNGEVTLSGTVQDKKSKRLAEDIAEDINGAGNVQNNIKVSKEDKSTSTNETKKSNSHSSTDKREKAHQLN